MDGFDVTVSQLYRAKVAKDKKKPAPNAKKEKPLPKRDCDKSKKRSKDKTLSAIGKSTSEDVCSCIRVLTEYIKEALRLVMCAPCKDDTFGPLFCELGDVTIRLFHDAYNFIKLLVFNVLRLISV